MPRPERPLDRDGSPLVDFAADLRQLRRRAGCPPYRRMAVDAHFAASTLAEAAGGKRLPTLEVTLAYARVCGGDVEEWGRRWRALADELDDAAAPSPADGGPYVGLATYGQADAGRFFGRERLVDELVEQVGGHRFLGVFGASGAGKSSALRAGLLARWAQRGPALILTPGAHPLEECAVHVAALLGATAGAVRAELAADPAALRCLLRQAVAALPEGAELLLVVDQFEEMFTLCQDAQERARAITALLAAADGDRCRVVIGVRADFYAHCGTHPELAAALRNAQVLVGPMTAEELRRAITGPAAQAGLTVESALLTTLVAQAHGRPGALPLLSHALLETWRRRRGSTLTATAYAASGGIDGALAKTAETAFRALDARGRLIAKDLFRRLVALGDRTEDTKRRVPADELDDDPSTAVVLDRLTEARLLVRAHDGIEISHEALIRAWPRLGGWLAADRDGQRVHRELAEATRIWVQHDRDPGALYRGARLAVAREWVAGGGRPNSREHAFLVACGAAEERERLALRRRTRLLHNLVGVLAVLLVAAVVATALAVTAVGTAQRRRDVALSLKVAGDAVELSRSDPGRAAQLSLAAYRLDPSPAAFASLVATTDAAGAEQLIGAALPTPVPGMVLVQNTVTDTAQLRADRNLGTLRGASGADFTADGRTAVTQDGDAAVRLWDIADPVRPVELGQLPVRGLICSLSPGGRVLVTVDVERSGGEWRPGAVIRLWDVSDPRSPRQAARLPGGDWDVAYSDRSGLLAQADVSWQDGRLVGGSVLVWDAARLDRPGQPAVLDPGDEDAITSLSFLPDGRRLVLGGENGTVTIWDTAGPPRELARVDVPGIVNDTAVSPDGRTLVVGSSHGAVAFWDITEPAAPRRIASLAGTGAVGAFVFAHDSKSASGLEYRGASPVRLRRWPLDPELAAAAACAHAPLTPDQWAEHFADLPYVPPC